MNSDNLDPKRENQDQMGSIGDGAGSAGAGQGAGDGDVGGAEGAVDLSKVDFSKADWSKVPWKGEYAEDPAMEKHKSPISLIKANKELERLVGLDKLPMPVKPKERATQQEIDTYNKQMATIFTRLGRPESADKYDIKGINPEDSLFGKIKEKAFEGGVSNEALNNIAQTYIEWYQNRSKEIKEARIEASKKAIATIKEKWGTGYDERVAVAQKAYNVLVNTDKLKKIFGGVALGNNPDILEFFYTLGTSISEDLIAGKGRVLTKTPAEAKRQIEELKIKQTKLQHGSPEYEMLQKQIDGLYKVAYPKLAQTAE